MTQWIKCSERLPEADQDVFIGRGSIGGDNGEVARAYLRNDKWFYYEHGELEIMSVKWRSDYEGWLSYWTHWQPLPEPPTEDEE